MSEEKNEADYQRGWAAGNEAASDRMAGLEQAAAKLAVERAEFRREAETLRAQLAEAYDLGKAMGSRSVIEDIHPVLSGCEHAVKVLSGLMSNITKTKGCDMRAGVVVADELLANITGARKRAENLLAAQQQKEGKV